MQDVLSSTGHLSEVLAQYQTSSNHAVHGGPTGLLRASSSDVAVVSAADVLLQQQGLGCVGPAGRAGASSLLQSQLPDEMQSNTDAAAVSGLQQQLQLAEVGGPWG